MGFALRFCKNAPKVSHFDTLISHCGALDFEAGVSKTKRIKNNIHVWILGYYSKTIQTKYS